MKSFWPNSVLAKNYNFRSWGTMVGRLRNNQLISRKETVTERKIDNASFLVDEETDSIFHLNQLGTVLWQLLSKPQSADQAASLLCAAFPEVDQQTITLDTIRLFQQLVDKGLVILE